MCDDERAKRTKGITLLALVITIIILLILAGISIQAITSDNGLFKRAKQAKQNTIDAQELENSILDSYNEMIENQEKGETADELLAKMEEEGTVASMAGKEVTYIKYKDKDGNQQDKWIIIYIGKNKDTAEDVADDMPTNENHIYLLPKYSVANISPAGEKIAVNNTNKIVEAQIDTTAGYSSVTEFKDEMRDANNWSAYALGAGSKAHGAMSVVQYNMCVEWIGTYRHLGNGTDYYWLSDPVENNAISCVDPDGGRAVPGYSHVREWLSIRPIVMLGTNCKLTSDGRIIY